MQNAHNGQRNDYVEPPHALTPQDTMLFLHIPKTAGTSLQLPLELKFVHTTIYAPYWIPSRAALKPGSLAEYRLLRGHFYYDQAIKLLGKVPIVATMLRDPVERVLSFYSFTKQPGYRFRHEALKGDLLSYLLNPDICPHVTNLQTKMLAVQYPRVSPDDPVPLNREYVRLSVDAASLERAKHLLETCAFVGLTERFRDSLALFAYTFGWQPDQEEMRENKTLVRTRRADLTQEELDTILALNEYDMQLYCHAQQLFETRFAEMQHRLLERYGDRTNASLQPPLPHATVLTLLEKAYVHEYRACNPAASTMVFSPGQMIPGAGWHRAEVHPIHGFFRWTGPQIHSTLDLPLAAECDVKLSVHILLVLAEEILTDMQVLMNSVLLMVDRSQAQSGMWVLEAIVPRTVLERQPGLARLQFVVPRTLVPNQLDPGNPDQRALGVAIHQISVSPV